MHGDDLLWTFSATVPHFSFLINKHNTEMVLDPYNTEIYQAFIEQED